MNACCYVNSMRYSGTGAGCAQWRADRKQDDTKPAL